MSATAETNFDLFRLNKAKEAVDVCENTLRSWSAENPKLLPIFRIGKTAFMSKAMLAAFIQTKGR